MRGFIIAAAMVAGAGLLAFVVQPGTTGGDGAFGGFWPLAIVAAVALLILSAGFIWAARQGLPDDGGMRAPAWYWARLELAIGIGVLLSVVLLAWLAVLPSGLFGGDSVSVGPLWLRSGIVVSIAALAGAVAGLAWMLRILRGVRDEPPPWRYRDR